MKFELSRNNVRLGFLTFLPQREFDWQHGGEFTRQKDGEFDLDAILDAKERTELQRLIDQSNEIPSGIPPAWRVGEGGEMEPPPERTYKRGEDREWFEAFLKKLRGLGYIPTRAED